MLAVKKAPKKPAVRSRQIVKKAAPKKRASLQSRLEAEFSQAVNSARFYITDPERLRQLVTEAAGKVPGLPKEQFKETWAYLMAMLRLIRAYYRGEYRRVPIATLLFIVAAVIYLINPLDLIPDWIPGLGFLDDAFVLALAVRKTRATLDDFMAWEIIAG